MHCSGHMRMESGYDTRFRYLLTKVSRLTNPDLVKLIIRIILFFFLLLPEGKQKKNYAPTLYWHECEPIIQMPNSTDQVVATCRMEANKEGMMRACVCPHVYLPFMQHTCLPWSSVRQSGD